ncbi:MAG: hypothetical protein Q4G50_09775 [Corynebacterium sp.]|uniref:hypothetical protein n=1 Tax=Corynebacterium sp. TaxID=1720 RepID=UPI0026E0425C|nr:hypothetical protein [Corynebacterium sp.]MDO5670281.1 hypothetical protein [Corynebacterium sp.]
MMRFLIAAVITAPLTLHGCSNSSSENPPSPESSAEVTTPTTTSTVAAPAAPSPEGIDTGLMEEIVDVSLSTLEDPTASLDLSEVLTAAALEDIENQRQEWAVEGWHQEGEASVTVSDIEPSDNPSVVRAQVCVDSSEVRVVDGNGVVINADVPAEERRSLMVVTFVQEGELWRMAERTFPDDPRC